MRNIITQIDKDADLRKYVDAHGGRFTSSQSRELKYEKYEMVCMACDSVATFLSHDTKQTDTPKAVKVEEPVTPMAPVVKSRQVFGIPLQQLTDQEGSEVPMILRVCTQTIEAYGT